MIAAAYWIFAFMVVAGVLLVDSTRSPGTRRNRAAYTLLALGLAGFIATVALTGATR